MSDELSYVRHPHSFSVRLARAVWGLVWVLLYRPSPRPFHAWRRLLLRCFGARVGAGTHPYPSLRVWAPWNLVLGRNVGVGDDVDCYCVERITIGDDAVVSQRAFLCAASHDYNDPKFRLVTAPITIGPRAWVCAEAMGGPGVTVGEGAVIGAKSVVTKDVEPWHVMAGNPARVIKRRVIRQGDA